MADTKKVAKRINNNMMDTFNRTRLSLEPGLIVNSNFLISGRRQNLDSLRQVGRVARVSIGIPVLAAELGHNSAEGAPGSGFWNLGLGLIFLSRSSIHPHQRFCLAEIKSPTAPRPIFRMIHQPALHRIWAGGPGIDRNPGLSC